MRLHLHFHRLPAQRLSQWRVCGSIDKTTQDDGWPVKAFTISIEVRGGKMIFAPAVRLDTSCATPLPASPLSHC